MDAQRRFTTIFIAGCVAVAAVVCVAIALGLIQLIGWTFGNCGTSTACTIAAWTISYWWVVFVPTCVGAALLLRRMHDRFDARAGKWS